MKTTQETLRIKDNIKETILYTAFELSLKKWKLAFSNKSQPDSGWQERNGGSPRGGSIITFRAKRK
jgi:hypothetical protein